MLFYLQLNFYLTTRASADLLIQSPNISSRNEDAYAKGSTLENNKKKLPSEESHPMTDPLGWSTPSYSNPSVSAWGSITPPIPVRAFASLSAARVIVQRYGIARLILTLSVNTSGSHWICAWKLHSFRIIFAVVQSL